MNPSLSSKYVIARKESIEVVDSELKLSASECYSDLTPPPSPRPVPDEEARVSQHVTLLTYCTTDNCLLGSPFGKGTARGGKLVLRSAIHQSEPYPGQAPSDNLQRPNKGMQCLQLPHLDYLDYPVPASPGSPIDG